MFDESDLMKRYDCKTLNSRTFETEEYKHISTFCSVVKGERRESSHYRITHVCTARSYSAMD